MCFFCKAELPAKIGFRDECLACGRPLHICKNCVFYKPGAYHDCEETQADYVKDKESMNFCEYFKAGSKTRDTSMASDTSKKKFNDLFS